MSLAVISAAVKQSVVDNNDTTIMGVATGATLPAGTTVVLVWFIDRTITGTVTATDSQGNLYTVLQDGSGTNIDHNSVQSDTRVVYLISRDANNIYQITTPLTDTDTFTITCSQASAWIDKGMGYVAATGLDTGNFMVAAEAHFSYGSGTLSNSGTANSFRDALQIGIDNWFTSDTTCTNGNGATSYGHGGCDVQAPSDGGHWAEFHYKILAPNANENYMNTLGASHASMASVVVLQAPQADTGSGADTATADQTGNLLNPVDTGSGADSITGDITGSATDGGSSTEDAWAASPFVDRNCITQPLPVSNSTCGTLPTENFTKNPLY